MTRSTPRVDDTPVAESTGVQALGNAMIIGSFEAVPHIFALKTA